MAETKRTGIIDKDGGNILANVVESTATPGTYGLVALNPDGSDIGGPASAIVIGNPVVGGDPGRILYIDQAGNLFGDDAAVRDSGVQKQTTIGSGTYAQASANDGVSAEVYFQADVIGDTGNSISLVFDGIDDADTVLNAWNTANPGNTASIVDGVGTTVPTAGTRPFIGGGEIIYESGTVNNGISTFFQGSGSTLLDTTNSKIGFSTTGNLISVIGEPSLGFVAAGIDSVTGNLGAMVVSDLGINFFVTDQSTYNARLTGDDVEIILAYNGTYLGVDGLSGPLWGDSSSNRYILPTNVTPSVGDTLAVAGISGNDYALDFVAGGVTIGNAVSGGTNNTILFIDGSGNLGSNADLFYDEKNILFHVGDSTASANETLITLDDQNSIISNQTDGTFIVRNSAAADKLSMDMVSDIYQMGNLAGSGPRFKLYTDATVAKLSYLDTGIVSEVRVVDTGITFIYSDATAGATLSGGSGAATLTATSFSTSNSGKLDARTTQASLYFQDGGTFSYRGVRATNGVVDIGDYGGTNLGTLLTVDDTATTIKLTGGIINNYTAQTTTYNILRNDYTINCTSGTFTATLPTAVGFAGQTYVIKNSGAGVITLATTSSQTIDGVTTQTIVAGISLTVTSTGSNRIII